MLRSQRFGSILATKNDGIPILLSVITILAYFSTSIKHHREDEKEDRLGSDKAMLGGSSMYNVLVTRIDCRTGNYCFSCSFFSHDLETRGQMQPPELLH